MFLIKKIFVCAVLCSLLWLPSSQADEDSQWEQVIEKTAQSVLAIRVDGTRSFDTRSSNSAQATGFVVDAERGIVLTNRHVIQPGPVVATGIFLNREEIELTPIYRDPVHDFGFFKYDPKALVYNTPAALDLHPERVQLGREIRVIGNDGGEQLSILAGTISRLDRPAPIYGPGKYNDFNTFYIQAASSTSGGSSGAPVMDIDGQAIALNAGANRGNAASFFLPLDRVVRALELIRQGLPVVRGTLQTTFKYQPYDELKRLGLTPESERFMRQQDATATGLLTVDSVVPGGPGAGQLQTGDILLKANGQWLRHFVALAALLDEQVGQTVVMTLERGGQMLDVTLSVQDLDQITPASYVDVGGAILHDLSYQQARNFHLPTAGVYVAKNGYMLGNEAIRRQDVITSIANQPVSNLAEAEVVLQTLADGERFPVHFFSLNNPRQEKQRVVTMDRRWFTAETCQRNDDTGLWPCKVWSAPPAAGQLLPKTTALVGSHDAHVHRLAPSLVVVNYNMPFPVEGVSNAHYIGSGLIVDAQRGWVVVDRNTVPSALGDVYLTFAESLEIPGKVVFIHPFHNLAIVSYDPALIGDTPVRSAQLSSKVLSPGEDVWLVGPKANQRLTVHKTTVADIDTLNLPLPAKPAFRETNTEVITLTSKTNTVGGVLANAEQEIVALWASFEFQKGKAVSQLHAGVPVELITELLDILGGDSQVPLRNMGFELQLISLAEARKRGLPDDWVQTLAQHDPQRRRVLYIGRLVAGSPAAEVVKAGDILLAINRVPVTTFRAVEQAAQAPEIDLTVLRRGQVQQLKLTTESLTGRGLDRVLSWAGAMLHRPHRAIAAQRGFAEEGLYVSWTWLGSPAAHYGLARSLRLVALNGLPVTDIDSFVAILSKTKNEASVRLKVLNLAGKERVLTLKLDDNYWPTVELVRTEQGWVRRNFKLE